MPPTKPKMTVDEATQRLVDALVAEFADCKDDEQIPVRMFLGRVARLCGATLDDPDEFPEWESVGWLRGRLAGAARHADSTRGEGDGAEAPV